MISVIIFGLFVTDAVCLVGQELYALSRNCEKRLLDSSCPSVRIEQLDGIL